MNEKVIKKWIKKYMNLNKNRLNERKTIVVMANYQDILLIA